MNERNNILIFIFLVVDIVLMMFLYKMKIFEFVLYNDATFITLSTITIYFLMNFAFFYVERIYDPDRYAYVLNLMWYVVNLLTALGFLGTMIGFFAMMHNLFGNLNLQEIKVDEIKTILVQMTSGLGIAIMTSIAGLITSTILSFKLYVLNHEK